MDKTSKIYTATKLLAIILMGLLILSILKVLLSISRVTYTSQGTDLKQVVATPKLNEEQIKSREEKRAKTQKDALTAAQVKTSIEIMKRSGLFGSPPKPRPSTLIGIAGDMAIIQTGSGGTKAMSVDETFQNVKLLKLDTNRALIEENGKTRELTLYSGMGSESLIDKGGD